MGNRTNIGFRGPSLDGNTLYLYGHWGFGNTSLGEVLNTCKSRWDDDAYAVRRMVALFLGDDGTDETGYGLTINGMSDNENVVYTVDFNEQRVYDSNMNSWAFGDPALDSIIPGQDTYED